MAMTSMSRSNKKTPVKGALVRNLELGVAIELAVIQEKAKNGLVAKI